MMICAHARTHIHIYNFPLFTCQRCAKSPILISVTKIMQPEVGEQIRREIEFRRSQTSERSINIDADEIKKLVADLKSRGDLPTIRWYDPSPSTKYKIYVVKHRIRCYLWILIYHPCEFARMIWRYACSFVGF